MKILSGEKAIYFRDQFRQARAAALRDAEGFTHILFALERLGFLLCGQELLKKGKLPGLGSYIGAFEKLAKQSPLAEDIRSDYRNWHVPFSVLYDLVKDARNDALHQGAYARHLTTHAIQLSLILEDALMSDLSKVGDYMIRDVVCASLWQPMSFIRQTMLANSFTYLPVLRESEWYLISDADVAKYLRLNLTSKNERKKRLAKTLQTALDSGKIDLGEKAQSCSPADSLEYALELFKDTERPILVIRDDPRELIGILTAFDLL